MTVPDSGANVNRAAGAGTGHDPPDLIRLRQLADEQAALRRVATLVAGGTWPAEVFTAVASELGRLIGAEASFVSRLDHLAGEDGEPEGSATVVGSYGRLSDQIPVGFRTRLVPGTIQAAVLRTGHPALVKDDRLAQGPYGEWLGGLGLRAGVAAPIMVGGSYWGVAVAVTSQDDFPPGTESRMADFTELAATAIANAQAEEELRRLADTQAALRRVATLVARGIDPTEIFSAVAEEFRRLLDADDAGMGRFEPDGTSAVVLRSVGQDPIRLPVGSRPEHLDYLPSAAVWRTRPPRPGRRGCVGPRVGPRRQRPARGRSPVNGG